MLTKSIAAPLFALSLLAVPAFSQTVGTENMTTVETAEIQPPASAEPETAESLVLATTGEMVGKVVSMVPSSDTTPAHFVVQVDTTISPDEPKNVTLEEIHFTEVDDQYVVNVTYDEFLVLVAEQNPT